MIGSTTARGKGSALVLLKNFEFIFLVLSSIYTNLDIIMLLFFVCTVSAAATFCEWSFHVSPNQVLWSETVMLQCLGPKVPLAPLTSFGSKETAVHPSRGVLWSTFGPIRCLWEFVDSPSDRVAVTRRGNACPQCCGLILYV